MKISTLISKLAESNISLKLEGDQLKLSASKEALTNEIIKEIQDHKQELISFLKTINNESSYESIKKQEKKEYYPLSSAQKRLYVLQKTDESAVNYNLPIFLKLEGDLDIDRLKKVFKILVQRHEMLRTSFNVVDGEVMQKVHDDLDFELGYDEMKEEEIAAYSNKFIGAFDLEKAPLLKAGLVKVADKNYVLLIDMHHIITDGVSFRILSKELMDLYSGENLSEIKINYLDYSVWQNEKRESGELDAVRDYWLSEYKTNPVHINLPYDLPRPKQFKNLGDQLIIEFKSNVKEKIKLWMDSNKISGFMFFFSIYKILLSKLSGQNDIVVGVPIANRTHTDLEKIIGMFVNTLAIRSYPDKEKSYKEFLAEIKEVCINSFENQEYQLDELVEALDLPRETNRTPLFDVAFAMQNMDIPNLVMDGVKIQNYPMDFRTSKFDLTITVVEHDNSYMLQFDYNTELFTRETILKFADYYKKIVNIVLDDSSILLKDIELLPGKEKSKILTWSSKDKKENTTKGILDIFKEQVNKNPDKVAVSFNGKQLTYKELDEKSTQLSNLLQKNGIKNDTKTGIISGNAIEMAIGILSAIKSGTCFIPMRYSETGLDKMLKDADINILLKSPDLNIETSCATINIDETVFGNESATNLNHTDSLYNACYGLINSNNKNRISYITYQNILDLTHWSSENIYAQYGENINISSLAPMDSRAFVSIFLTAILNGHKLNIPSKEETETSNNTLEYYKQNKIQISDGLPGLVHNLASLDDKLFEDIHLKHLVIEGSQINKKDLSALLSKSRKLKIHLNHIIPEINQVGTTLLIDQINIFEYDENTIGNQLTNSVTITNPEDALQAIGLKGNLCMELDDNWFIVNNQQKLKIKNEDQEYAYLKTNDYVKWLVDGKIEYCEREGSIRKSGWNIICLEEIKEYIKNYQGINDAHIALNNDNFGSIDIYYEAENEISEKEFSTYFFNSIYNEEIQIKFIHVKKFPRLQDGSVDMSSILSKTEKIEGEENLEIQEGLFEIWKKLLKKEEIDKEANFFALGGNSLKALMLVNQINKQYDKKLLVTDIFDHLTIKDLSIFLNTSDIKEEKFEEITKIEDSEYYEVSSAQKRLYVIYELDKASVAYNIPFLYELKGNIDLDKIENIFNQLVNRHDSLRTYFEIIKDRPVQKILDHIDFKINIIEDNGDKELIDIMSELIRPFDLSKAPLIRIILVKTQGKNYLFIDVHHIVVDGFSVAILVDEFKKLYMGEQLPELEIQYKDFAKWQIEENERIKEQENYWLNEFSGEIPVLNLPYDFKRPLVKEFAGENENFTIVGKDVEMMEKLAINEKATLNMLMLSIYKIFLHKLSGDEDIIVGMPVGGREHAGLDNMVGMFLNTLAFRTGISADKTFMEYFKEVKEKVLQANLNQSYPFEEVIDKVGVERDTGRNPIFDAMLVYQEVEDVDFSKLDIELNPAPVSNNTAKFDITLFGTKKENTIAFNFEYSTELFKKETIQKFIKYFKAITKAITQNPDIKISDIEIMDEPEKNNVMELSQGIVKQWDNEETILSCFEKTAEKKSGETALVFHDKKMSYKELNEKANQLAGVLIEKGTKPNDIIGLMTTRSFEMIIGIFAIIKARAACLPIDSKYPEDRKAYMLKDSNVKLLLTNMDTSENTFIPGDTEIINLGNEETYRGKTENLNNNNQSTDLIYIIYTSGSTGTPKGVMMQQGNLHNLMKFDQEKTSLSANKVLQFASISFDMSFNEIFLALLGGGELFLINEEIQGDFDELLLYIQKHEIETLVLPMSVIKVIFNDEIYSNKISKSIKHILIAGEQLAISNMFRQYLQKNKVTIHNHYGPSETHVVTTLELNPENHIPELPTIGRPIYNTNTYILDKQNNLLPTGVAGELCVTGKQVGAGYLGKKDLTEKHFIPCPFENNTTMYKTGDLARWLPDGNIEFLGRIDKQIKIRGYRVEPGEIETQIMKFEGVKEAVVIIHEHKKEKNLCAYIVGNESLDLKMLKAFLLDKIPEYMVPASFMQLNKIPATSNGKVDYRKLPEPEIKKAEYVAPENEIQETMVKIWAEVLNIESNEISIEADFFDLGGHSLKATVAISKMHKEFNVKLKLNELFRFPTIRELSGLIVQNQQEHAMADMDTEEFEEFVL